MRDGIFDGKAPLIILGRRWGRERRK